MGVFNPAKDLMAKIKKKEDAGEIPEDTEGTGDAGAAGIAQLPHHGHHHGHQHGHQHDQSGACGSGGASDDFDDYEQGE